MYFPLGDACRNNVLTLAELALSLACAMFSFSGSNW